jgi:ADP-heptose:LPS heptosyltransferase
MASRGFMVMITGGDRERKLTSSIQYSIGSGAIDTTPLDLNLGELASLISHSLLLISNDTGVSHLACATQTPSIVIFQNETNFQRWAPLDQRLHHSFIAKGTETIDAAMAILHQFLNRDHQLIRYRQRS